MKYLTIRNTWTENPDLAKKFSKMPDPNLISESLAIFNYRGKYIIGISPNVLQRNPSIKEQFSSKKFALRCKAEKVEPDVVKSLITQTPPLSLTGSERERALSWIISKFCAGNILLEDIGENSKLTEYLDLFYKHKDKLENRNINDYEYPAQIFAAVKPLANLSEKTKVIPSKIPDATFVAANNFGEIWTPETAEASCALGKGTEWCTAKYPPDDSRNKFDEYDYKGPLYIWFDKATGKRWQAHCDSEMMDEDDNPDTNVNFEILLFEKGIFNKLNLSSTGIAELPEIVLNPVIDHEYEVEIDLRNTKISKLPDNLFIDGSLDISSTPITRLPKNLEITGKLYACSTGLREIPDDISVGSLNLAGSRHINSLPDNFHIPEYLNICDTNIKELPENLEVGLLNMEGTLITEIPETAKIKSLHAANSKLEKLPDNVTEYDSLYLNGTNVKKLPDNLKVRNSLYMPDTKIEKLPKNMVIGNFLRLNKIISELPENLTVFGEVYYSGPNNLKIHPTVRISRLVIGKSTPWPRTNGMYVTQENIYRLK